MDIFLSWFEACWRYIYPVLMTLYEWFDKIFLTTVADLLGNDPAVLVFVPGWMEALNLANVMLGAGLISFVVVSLVKWVVGIIT